MTTPASAMPRSDVQYQLDALFGRLYPRVLVGDARADTLRHLCEELGRLYGFALIVLLRKQKGGVLTIEAASAESGLWNELKRVPEHWDEGATVAGPAGACLRAGKPEVMLTDQPGFSLWRPAAVRERVDRVIAWPITAGHDTYVLEFFSAGREERGGVREFVAAGAIAKCVETFLADLVHCELQQLLARALECAGNAAFITDLEGAILWCNRAFSALSRYPAEEIIGNNPRFLKSGQMGLRYYRELWSTIRSGQVWSGETVDRDRDGIAYTIRQTISPVAVADRITHYFAVHDDISQQKIVRERLERAVGTDQVTGLLMPAAFRAEVQKILAEGLARGAQIALGILSLRESHAAAGTAGLEAEFPITSTLGQRLRRALGPDALASPIEPGEFMFLLRGPAAAADAANAWLISLREALDRPPPNSGDRRRLDYRVGLARFPEHGRNYEELVHHADRLLANEPFGRARRTIANSWPDLKPPRH